MLYFESTGYRTRAVCKDAVVWFVDNYLPRYKLDIEVNHRGLKREGVQGWCNIKGDTYRPRSFFIEIHYRLNMEDYLLKLFHELTHVKQYVKGELKDRRSHKYWKNEDISHIEYDDDPSEVEARDMEEILYCKYMNIPVRNFFSNRLTKG